MKLRMAERYKQQHTESIKCRYINYSYRNYKRKMGGGGGFKTIDHDIVKFKSTTQ